MAITHLAVKVSGEKGYASEWNADHVVPVAEESRRTITLIVAASDSNDTTRADYFCDGTADEIQINQAISDLPASGGQVILMDGTFTIATSITIDKSNVSIVGQGAATIIDASAWGALDNMMEANTKGYIFVDKIKFLGNINNSNGVELKTCTDCIISNCIFDSCYECMYIVTSCARITIYANKIYGFDGVYANNVNEVIIIGNQILNCTDLGIYIINSNRSTVTNNIVYNSGGHGIEFYGSYHVVSNNISYSNGRSGIKMGDGNDCTISGNICYSNVEHGIEINGLDNSSIVGNSCYNNDVNNTTSFDGISLVAVSDYNIVASNRCRENDNYEININHVTDDKNLVHGNICIGVDHVGAINDAGTGTVLANNIVA